MERQAYSEMAEMENKLWWYISRRHIIQKILDAFVVKKTSQNILEIGCGPGGNLPSLSEYGKLHAVEHDAAMRDLAAEKNLCPIQAATLPNPLPFDCQFDLIAMFDVLEHIEDQLGTLTTIKQSITRNGILAISVPAYMFLWSPHDDAVHHKIRYTIGNLRQILESAGFEILYSSYFNTLLFPLILVFRLLRRWFSQDNQSDIKLPNPVLNKIFTIIFGLEKFFLPKFKFPCGLSIIVIATPSKSHNN
jgi:SAM-dependent methyltransferase